MMYDLSLAWRNLRNRPIEALIPIIVVGLAIALSVSVIVLADGTEEGIIQASDPFGVLVVGSAGSGQQLVLSSILLQGNPIGNIPYDVYEELENDERVRLAVPLAFGDNVGGSRIIGTNHNFFELRVSQASGPAFQLAEGRLFEEVAHEHEEHHEEGEGHSDESAAVVSDEHEEDDEHEEHHEEGEGHSNESAAVVSDEHEEDDEHEEHHEEGEGHSDESAAVVSDEHEEDDEHEEHHEEGEEHSDHEHNDEPLEAVLGSAAAARLGLSIGDQFLGTHGVGSGIAENLHDEHPYVVVGILQPSGTAYDSAVYTQLQAVWDVHAHEEDEESGTVSNPLVQVQEAGGAVSADQVTSVLLLPTGFIEQNQLAQEFYVDPTLQAAFPGEELGGLLNLLNQGQQVLNWIGYLVLGIAGLTVFLSMYSTIIARKQSIAIMRGLGSSRGTVFRVIVFETLIVAIAGGLIGRIIGYGVALGIAMIFSEGSAIPILVRFLPDLEILLWVLSIGVGLAAGIIPGLMAYRVNVVEHLFPA